MSRPMKDIARRFVGKSHVYGLCAIWRWPCGLPVCPACGGSRTGTITSRGIYWCKECYKQFGLKTDTLFEDSPVGIDKWCVAVWAIANKTRVTCSELGAVIGVQPRTAWYMLRRIRAAMQCANYDATPCGTTDEWESFARLMKCILSVRKRDIISKLTTIGRTQRNA